MKIKNIALNKTLPFNDSTIEFHDKLNVLTGSNGTGKSLILRMIMTLFRSGPVSKELATPHIQPGGELNAIFEFGNKLLEIKSSNAPISSSHSNQSIIKRQQIQQEQIEHAPRLQVSSSLIPTGNVPIIIYIESSRGKIGVHDQTTNDQWRNASTDQRFAKLLRLYEIIFDQDGGLERKYQELLQRFFPNMATVIKIRSRGQNQRVMDVKSFSNNHDGNTLASGCLEILFIVGETAFLKDSIIIIDEPELHLHPLAQDMMSEYLRYLTTPEGGNNQVIIATHSISLIYGGRDGRVINLRREDDRVTPEAVIDGGKPTLNYAGALQDLGYSGHAVNDAREFYKKFRASKTDYQPPAIGGWAFGD